MDDDYSDKINIDDLYQRKREIDQLKLKVFRKILNRVHSKIKITSRQRSAEQFTFLLFDFLAEKIIWQTNLDKKFVSNNHSISE